MGLPAAFCHAKWEKWGNARNLNGMGEIRKNAADKWALSG